MVTKTRTHPAIESAKRETPAQFTQELDAAARKAINSGVSPSSVYAVMGDYAAQQLRNLPDPQGDNELDGLAAILGGDE